MKSLMILGCAATAALFMTAGSAQAQCGYGGGFYGGSGINIGYNSFAPRSSFNIGYSSFAPRHSFASQRTAFRPVGHYDYHPTAVYRHRNHLHVQPGHYDFHRGSHHRGRFHR